MESSTDEDFELRLSTDESDYEHLDDEVPMDTDNNNIYEDSNSSNFIEANNNCAPIRSKYTKQTSILNYFNRNFDESFDCTSSPQKLESDAESTYHKDTINIRDMLFQLLNAKVIVERLPESVLQKTSVKRNFNVNSNRAVNRPSSTFASKNMNRKNVSSEKKCEYCGGQFASDELRKLHMHHCKNKPSSCRLCSFTGATIRELCNHYLKAHWMPMITFCPKCKSKRFDEIKNPRLTKSMLHCDVCDSDIDYRCPLCNIIFTSFKVYYRHLRTNCDKVELWCNKMHTYCVNCDAEKLSAHFYTNCKRCKASLLYSCDTCDARRVPINDACYHIQEYYNSVPLACKFCSKRFRSKKGYHKHQLVCMSDITYPCDKCSFKTKYMNSLQQHRERKHRLD